MAYQVLAFSRSQTKHEVFWKAVRISRDSPVEVGGCDAVEGSNIDVEDDPNIPNETDLRGREGFVSIVVTKLFTHIMIINKVRLKSKRQMRIGMMM